MISELRYNGELVTINEHKIPNLYPLNKRCLTKEEIKNAKLVSFNCGHYIHYYKSNEMSKEIIEFGKSI